jgi:ornithine cyclodeaminase/alanine dehydrogenase-like protein (mu-crystallin family)
MRGPTLRLRHIDVLRAMEEFDLLEVMAEELVRPALDAPDHALASRFVPADDGANGSDELAVEDAGTGQICLLPKSSLRMVRSAGLSALAARELHPPGVVTAAILGSSEAAQLHLSVIARHVPNLSHAALYPGGALAVPQIEQTLLDQLELAGIGVSLSDSPRRAASGANLVVVTDFDQDRLDIGQLPPGALVVNASGRDLPPELLTGVDQVYVDDLGLLDDNSHRTVVRLHQTGPDLSAQPQNHVREGWYRHEVSWRRQRRIEADLGQVLTGARGRTYVDDVLLAELLGQSVPDVVLAGRIHQTAAKHGLGRRINAAQEE